MRSSADHGSTGSIPREIKARLVPQGMDISTGSPAQLKDIISSDYAQWGKVMATAGIKGE